MYARLLAFLVDSTYLRDVSDACINAMILFIMIHFSHSDLYCAYLRSEMGGGHGGLII